MPDSLSRPASRRATPGFSDAAHRAGLGAAFSTGADVYARVRPGYPREVADLVGSARRIVDLGAGTGKLAETYVGRPDREVYALDPSADMVRTIRGRLDIPAWRATAEATGLAENSMDAAVCAQTWHWVDTEAASQEADRIIRPGGRLVLAWNVLDVSHPWVLRLSRIMHSGDIHRPGFYPEVGGDWQLVDELRTTWVQHLRPAEIYLLTQTRSYWLRANERTRKRVTENLRWYLFDRLGFAEDQLIALPYRSDAFAYERAAEHTSTRKPEEVGD
ncbi:SAM-dependent methyltransferase [Corynebacterium yudongzhengii]|uniref:Class I SAM-dependent methyltransferase n=1 Tax=Corynebacterium yudongzhengii TaxID=2080740 RepID=A0A2U1T8K7_9CORY|nr:class I SAM-dependent methyltransferase [Corynebacterium yudongzhengii]AWB81944.1 SAM-dependent methyltransferase [Corynebacterium yudongzhengii]PWC02336.1 class I SAM-dependent methyltransferase [Corynebacterium yudongzhengii]